MCLSFGVFRPYRDAEWLEEEYQDKERTTDEIAVDCGVTKETIRRWLHRHNIDVRDKGARKGHSMNHGGKHTQEEWLREHYVESELSAEKVAAKAGVTEQAVLNWLKEHDIERRDTGMDLYSTYGSKRGKLENAEWLHKQYVNEQRTQTDIAEELDVTPPAVKYWLDKHGIDRRNTPNSRGGGDSEFQRDPKWDERRERRLEIDDHECQDCGVKEGDYYRSLDVHHLTKREEFVNDNGRVDWDKANAMDNMITLCQSCHLKRHHNES